MTTQQSTTPIYSTDLKLPAYPTFDEKKNPDIYGDATLVHQAVRVLQQYLDSYTGAVILAKVNGVNILTGQFVSLGNIGASIAGVGLATAANHTAWCRGFAINSGGPGSVISIQTFGIWPYGNGALVPGAKYYLDPVNPGGITPTAPTAAGQNVQYLGTALDVNNLLFRPSGKYLEL